MPRKTVRKGEQTPTRSFVLPYTKTKGASAIRLYQTTGRKVQEWQKLLVYDMLAVNEDGLWVHTKFGYSVPRRNGKNEVVVMRELTFALMALTDTPSLKAVKRTKWNSNTGTVRSANSFVHTYAEEGDAGKDYYAAEYGRTGYFAAVEKE